jgi:hypothetical protein
MLAQMIKKFPALYGNRRSVSVFTRASNRTVFWEYNKEIHGALLGSIEEASLEMNRKIQTLGMTVGN